MATKKDKAAQSRLVAMKLRLRRRLVLFTSEWNHNMTLEKYIIVPGEPADIPGFRIARVVHIAEGRSLDPEFILPDGSPKPLRPGDFAVSPGSYRFRLNERRKPQYHWDLLIPDDAPLEDISYYIYHVEHTRANGGSVETLQYDKKVSFQNSKILSYEARTIKAVRTIPDRVYVQDHLNSCYYRLDQGVDLPIYVLYDKDSFLVFEAETTQLDRSLFKRWIQHPATTYLTRGQFRSFCDPRTTDMCSLFEITEEIVQSYNAKLVRPFIDPVALVNAGLYFPRGTKEILITELRRLVYATMPDELWNETYNGSIEFLISSAEHSNAKAAWSLASPAVTSIIHFFNSNYIYKILTRIIEENKPCGRTYTTYGGDPRRINSYRKHPISVESGPIVRPSSHERMASKMKMKEWCASRGLALPIAKKLK